MKIIKLTNETNFGRKVFYLSMLKDFNIQNIIHINIMTKQSTGAIFPRMSSNLQYSHQRHLANHNH